MKIAYINTDEVNLDLAVRTAGEFSGVVFRLVSDSPAPSGAFDAVLYNLDEMPIEKRFDLFERLRLARPQRPTAVHGYDITREQAKVLRSSGVAAAKRLHIGLLRDLCIAARRRLDAGPEYDSGTDLTWVDLVE